MDFLRFSYKAKMKTIIGGEAVDIVWYPAAEGAELYEGPCTFRSRLWEDEPKNDGIGEQSEGRVCCGKQDVDWYGGGAPPLLDQTGDHCGSDAVAEHGAGPGDPTFMTGDLGEAPCCVPSFTCPTGATPVWMKFSWWPDWVPTTYVPTTHWVAASFGGAPPVHFDCIDSVHLVYMEFGGPTFPFTLLEESVGYVKFLVTPEFPNPIAYWDAIIEVHWPGPGP